MQLLNNLRVAHHRAPGEAEAECAMLQALGIVDAVWSDDGDALMFGCTTLIRQHKQNGERVKDHVRIYRADRILQEHDFDADSYVLFAMLAGGDYVVEGLRGCGAKTAAIVRRHSCFVP
jgi:holliday junction resolvase YEN1